MRSSLILGESLKSLNDGTWLLHNAVHGQNIWELFQMCSHNFCGFFSLFLTFKSAFLPNVQHGPESNFKGMNQICWWLLPLVTIRVHGTWLPLFRPSLKAIFSPSDVPGWIWICFWCSHEACKLTIDYVKRQPQEEKWYECREAAEECSMYGKRRSKHFRVRETSDVFHCPELPQLLFITSFSSKEPIGMSNAIALSLTWSPLFGNNTCHIDVVQSCNDCLL